MSELLELAYLKEWAALVEIRLLKRVFDFPFIFPILLFQNFSALD